VKKALLVLAMSSFIAVPAVFAAQQADACTPAPVITVLPYTDSGTTCGATNDITTYGGVCGTNLPFPYPGPDVIYAFTTTAGNSVAISASLTGSTGDLAVFVLDSCGVGSSCVQNSQDAIGAGAGPELIAAASYGVGTHYLYIESYYGTGSISCGTYTLSVTGNLPIDLESFSID
jgi:hypothetical protein